MSEVPVDPRWAKLLSLSVHEFRTPMTVVAGYIRMLLKERAGPLSDQQRRLLEEAEKSCGRLTGLLTEVSDLSNLEGGTAPLTRQKTDLHAALRHAVEQLPPLPDREVAVDLQLDGDAAPIEADPVRLTQAFSSVIKSLRRERFDEWRGGSGLILPIARRIIEAHGGRIWGAPDGRKAGARIALAVSG